MSYLVSTARTGTPHLDELLGSGTAEEGHETRQSETDTKKDYLPLPFTPHLQSFSPSFSASRNHGPKTRQQGSFGSADERKEALR